MHLTLKASSLHNPLLSSSSAILSPSVSVSLPHRLVLLDLSEEKASLLEPWRRTICHVVQIMSLSSSASSSHAFLHSQITAREVTR